MYTVTYSVYSTNYPTIIFLLMEKTQDTWKDQLEPCLSGCQEPVDDVKPCIIPGVKSLSATLEDCKTGMMTELQRCLEQDKFNYVCTVKN